jgi:hypothetical protein
MARELRVEYPGAIYHVPFTATIPRGHLAQLLSAHARPAAASSAQGQLWK